MKVREVLKGIESGIEKSAQAVGVSKETLDKIVSVGGWAMVGYFALKIINKNLNSKNEKETV